MNSKKRSFKNIACGLFLFSTIICIIAVFTSWHIVYRILCVSLYIIGYIMVLIAIRCPYCRKFGVPLRIRKDIIQCKKCGKIVEYH